MARKMKGTGKKEEAENTGQSEKTLQKTLSRLKSFVPLLIGMVAFAVRLIPYRLKYLIGYDPYFHLAYLEYVTEHGWVNYFPYALGPWGFLINHFHPKGLWGVPYLVYLLGKHFGLSITGAFKLTPPIFGALTVLTLYYTVKTLYSEKAALLSALILTFSFGHVFRSMSSYYRGDNYALFWYSFVLLLFSMALKEKNPRKKATLYVLAGLSEGLSSAFWSAYYMVLSLPLPIAVVIAAYSLFKGEHFRDSAMMIASTTIAVMIATLLGRLFGFGMFWVENWQGERLMAITGLNPGPLQDVYLVLHLVLLVPLTLLTVGLMWLLGSKLPENLRRVGTAGTLGVTIAILGVLIWKYGGTLEILSAGLSSFGSSATAEMSRPGWWDIKMAYHVFLAFFLAYPLSIRKFKLSDAFILGAALPLLLLSLYWTRFLFIGSFGLAMIGGVGADELSNLLQKNLKPLGTVLIIGLLAIGAYHSVKATHDVRPIVDEHWAKALTYLRGISNENDVVLTWWDHGHWVTYFAHRAAVAQGTPNRLVSRFYLGNTTKEELLELGVDYITVSFDTMLKWGSVKSTAGYSEGGYILILLPFRGAYGNTAVFENGKYQVAIRRNEGENWDVLVNAGGTQFIPQEVWIEDKGGPFLANVSGEKAGNAYLYVNLNYGYAVLMDRDTFSTPFARLMFTKEYPSDYKLVYTDGGMVKIFQLVHPNVVLDRSDGLTLRFTNATGDTLRIYGYTDSGERMFYREYNVSGMTDFKIPPDVKGEVIRYTYLKDGRILDRGVFRRTGGWN